jgi:hypothetical protein
MMSSYSIVKIGNDYVVRVHDQDLLKTTSRRNAERLVMQASQLLRAPSPPSAETTKVEADAVRFPPDAA